jgi:iron complex transport system substrate-binding protein
MIYHDVSPGWWTSGSGTLANEIFTNVKAKNIFDDISGWSQVSVEQIVSRNPQFIISVYPEGHEMLLNTDALQSVDAISNQKILTIESDLLAIEGPRLVQGMISIAEFLYPDIYR